MNEILCITTYPPRQCGIATFSDDLIRSIHHKFSESYIVRVCAVESSSEQHAYNNIVKYKLNTSDPQQYGELAQTINNDAEVYLVIIQHEFGLFREHETEFVKMLGLIQKPIVLVFHTVLSKPEATQLDYVRRIIQACRTVIVMTNTSALVLQQQYGIDAKHITIIPHGTHLVSHQDKKTLKAKYSATGRRVLSTFGLLSAGKSIETTLDALPAVVAVDYQTLSAEKVKQEFCLIY